MSATEIVARFKFDELTSQFVTTDVDWATNLMRTAHSMRAQFPSHGHDTLMYTDWTGECMFRSYMGQARAHGWQVSRAIDYVVRAELAAIEEIIAGGLVRFVEPGCNGDTCGDCGRPLCYHIDVDGVGRMCPFGRRFWQTARALMSRDCDSPGLGVEPFLIEIARFK